MKSLITSRTDRNQAKIHVVLKLAHKILALITKVTKEGSNELGHLPTACTDPEGRQGSRPLKNHKNIEFLSNTGQDTLKFSKVPSQRSILGHHRHALLEGRCWPAFSGIWILFPVKKKEKKSQNCIIGPL